MAKTEMSEPRALIYARYRRIPSKEARENLPLLVDEVVDSREPVLIEKLGVPRAAVVPARGLATAYQAAEALGLLQDRGMIDQPMDEVMKQIRKASGAWLEKNGTR